MTILGKRQLIYLLAVIGLLVFLHITKIISPLEIFISRSLNPVLSGLHSSGSKIRLFYNQKTDESDLQNLVTKLEEGVNKLTVEKARLKILEEENKILREYLSFFATKDDNFLLANIVSRNEISGLSQSFIIDKGGKDGLVPGLAVLNGQGVIIGKTTQVKGSVSQICFITNKSCQFAATIQNNDKTIGIARGELGLTIKMEFIPQTEEVGRGDLVVTSGLEKNIPRGLVIGRVIEVEKESNELWQTVSIEPLLDFENLTFVSVLLP